MLTTPDFQQQQFTLKSVDADGAILKSADGTETLLAWDKLVELRNPSITGSTPPFIFNTRDNQVFGGAPLALDGDKLTIHTQWMENLSLPLQQLDSFSKTADPGPPPDDRTEDVVRLQNGDIVRGVLSQFIPARGALEIQSSSGNTVTLPLETVQAVFLAQTGGEVAQPAGIIRLSLSDGTSCIVTRIQPLANDWIGLELAGGSRQVRLSPHSLRSIEPINGPATWLTHFTPIKNLQTPYLGATFPMQLDQSVDLQPLTLGSRKVFHGLGVHSHSTLVYAIDPAFKAFRTQVYIDPRHSLANVTLRIHLDDRVVYEKQDVTAQSSLLPIIVPLDGAKRLKLEVDYGKNMDVQDVVNWIEPALLKEIPAPAPTTAPASTAPSALLPAPVELAPIAPSARSISPANAQ